jgi:hypothetical protein
MSGKKKRYKVREHQLYTVRRPVWNQLKRENRIDDIYRFRARKINWTSRLFQPGAALQQALFRRSIRKRSFDSHPPVFILGVWRSGTTHLHYMMARDAQFGFLNNHQAFTFNLSLLSLDRFNKIFNIFVPGKRPQDNVKLTLDDPAEEEQPFSTMTPCSSIHSFYFPRNQQYFQKYHLFEGTTEQERDRWKKDYLFLLQNIAYYTRKQQLLLKNPHNTGRIRELLELFPEAKFIFLHRDPYTVYRSTRKLYNRMINSQFLQFISQREIERLILDSNSKILRKYLDERKLIPRNNLAEVAFETLEDLPMETLENIYSSLGLSGFEAARPHVSEYLESVKSYKKNRYSPLAGPLVQKINREWDFWFDNFGYGRLDP